MRRPWVIFIVILLLTFGVIFVNLPKETVISFKTPKLPLINKEISVNQKLQTFGLEGLAATLKLNRNFSFRKGLDLEGGTSITLKADMKGVAPPQRDNALESAKTVIERRINFFGVSEPVIQTSKANQDYRIIVEIPGVTDVNQAVRLIGTTAQLSFWEQGASGSATVSPEALPLGVAQVLGPDAKKTNLVGSDMRNIQVSFNSSTGEPEVLVDFTNEGAKKFGQITTRNVGKRIGFVLDNVLVDAPVVREAITGGTTVISGGFTTDRAKQLQIQLNAGALPISLSVLEQHGIGATLGQLSLQKSLIAGILGFLVIVLFMIGLYGRLGIIASVALVVYVLITLALFKLIPITLTLAGIAGFILSIGIAVDANILIFERMREELRRGMSRETAIEIGFSRAWTSIRDSNIASLITSVVLYYFGTGIVRGFALTLALGILLSMFSAIIVTRTFLRMVYRH